MNQTSPKYTEQAFAAEAFSAKLLDRSGRVIFQGAQHFRILKGVLYIYIYIYYKIQDGISFSEGSSGRKETSDPSRKLVCKLDSRCTGRRWLPVVVCSRIGFRV